MKGDNFTEVFFTPDNLDRFVVRSSVLNALTKSLELFSGRLLDVGCGKMPYKSYILEKSSVEEYVGLDIENALDYDKNVKAHISWNGITMPFQDNSFESAFATEVLEHCPEPEIVLKETYRVLKPGGIFFFTVPFLWPLHETPHDEYRYTPWSLSRHLKNSGFNEIEIHPLGGWHASMAQMLGLWVTRSPLSSKTRNLLSRLLAPVMKRLLKKDKQSPIVFKEGLMITGLYGTARK